MKCGTESRQALCATITVTTQQAFRAFQKNRCPDVWHANHAGRLGAEVRWCPRTLLGWWH